MTTHKVEIEYAPHKYQNEIYLGMEGRRFGVLVCHRRFGKTLFAIHSLALSAIENKKKHPRYAYLAPFLKQAKQIAWTYLSDIARQHPGSTINQSELWVQFPNNARITLFGADNADALRGVYLDGIVIDEPAQVGGDVWGSVILPALADRRGWAIFIGTPGGIDHFYQLYEYAKTDPEWYHCMYRADETKLDWLGEDDLATLRRTMSESQYRREMLCDFAASVDNVLLSIDKISEACARKVVSEEGLRGLPKVIGVDIARFGDDTTVIQKRWGHYAYQPQRVNGKDNMHVVGVVATAINEWQPDAVFIDGGRGEGVIDRLRQLGHAVVEVQFGAVATDKVHFANKRTEMWALMADWVRDIGVLPNDGNLKSDLSAPTYTFDASNRMVLEKKDDIKERLGRSPDSGDGLALTFAFPVQAKISAIEAELLGRNRKHAIATEPYTYPWLKPSKVRV